MQGELATVLTLKKLKDDEDGVKFTAHLARVLIGHDEDGDEISTLIVDKVEDTAGPQTVKRPRQPRRNNACSWMCSSWRSRRPPPAQSLQSGDPGLIDADQIMAKAIDEARFRPRDVVGIEDSPCRNHSGKACPGPPMLLGRLIEALRSRAWFKRAPYWTGAIQTRSHQSIFGIESA
jgi:hypothetical protein